MRYITGKLSKLVKSNIYEQYPSKSFLFLRKNHLWIGAIHQDHFTCSADPSHMIFVRILVAFSSCYVVLTELIFYYFVKCKCMSISDVNDTFFFAMKLNIIVLTCWDSLFIIVVFSSLKIENRLNKQVQKVVETKYGFVQLITVFCVLQDVIMWILIWISIVYLSLILMRLKYCLAF